MRLTWAVLVALPLVPAMVICCAPEGSAIFAAVLMVKTSVDGVEPLSVMLFELKLHNAPAGRPEQLFPGRETVELVKVTVPVNPGMGVIVMVDVAV